MIPLTNETHETYIRIIPLTTDENLPLSTYIEQVKDGYLRLDHPLQRYAQQWEKEKQSNLVRRVLQRGTFSPLLICTQPDKNGCEVYWLIDGKQRLTSLQAFIDGEFSISPKILDYLVTYDGVLYERKKNKTGKFGLKQNKRDGSLIPILDENGKIQKVRQTIDVRGLYYKDLPPELQRNIKKYMVPVQIKHMCTDKDIQLEIIDRNSGAPMNVAQLGKSRLGDKYATIVTKFAEHPFVLDKCGFTTTNKTKGNTERSVGEALALVSFGATGWIKDYKDLCSKMSDCLSEVNVNYFETILNKLDEATIKTDELGQHMKSKEFPIVIANFAYFMEKNYRIQCYGDFLQKFVSETKYQKIINTYDLDENNEEIYESYVSVYGRSPKDKSIIESKLNQMNEWLDEYLEKYCVNMIEEDDKDELSDAITDYIKEFDSIDLPKRENAAIESLMLCSGYTTLNFNEDGIVKFLSWADVEINNDILEDCITYGQSLFDWLERCDYNSVFVENNLPFLVEIVKALYNTGATDDETFVSWIEKVGCDYAPGNDLYEFDKENNPELYATIVAKRSMLDQSLSDYIGGDNCGESL